MPRDRRPYGFDKRWELRRTILEIANTREVNLQDLCRLLKGNNQKEIANAVRYLVYVNWLTHWGFNFNLGHSYRTNEKGRRHLGSQEQ